MPRGISTSPLIFKRAAKNVAEGLASQVEDLQETPLWKKVAGYALPIAASFAMGPLGGLLTNLSGGAGALGSLLGGGKMATTIAQGLGKGMNLLGQGLSKGVKGQKLLKTLGQTGLKSLYTMGASGLTKKLLDSGKSEKDIYVEGTPSEKELGSDAVKKYRKQFTDAKKAEKDMMVLGSIASTLAGQGADMYADPLKDWFKGLLPEKWSQAAKEAKKFGEETSKAIRDKQLMGRPLTYLDKFKSGQISSKEMKRLSSLTPEQLKLERIKGSPSLAKYGGMSPYGYQPSTTLEDLKYYTAKSRRGLSEAGLPISSTAQSKVDAWKNLGMAEKSRQLRYSPVTSGDNIVVPPAPGGEFDKRIPTISQFKEKDNILQGLIGGAEGRAPLSTQANRNQAIMDLIGAAKSQDSYMTDEFMGILSNIFRGQNYDEATVAQLLSEFYGRGQ